MKKIELRNFMNIGLVIIILTLTGLFLGSLEQPPSDNGNQKVNYGEAPELAELVEAGILPPVEERVPINPMIIQPTDEVGVYGGTWKMGLLSEWDQSMFTKTIEYENLVRWDPDWTRIIPNIAQSYEVNQNSTKFTFHLREGMRWSDGELFTSRDILFSFETLSNEELIKASWSGIFPLWLESGGKRVLVETPDNLTVVFKFQEPAGMFLQYLATPIGGVFTGRPYHFLKDYFIEYNPNITQIAHQNGYSSWIEFFWSHVANSLNIECPTLNAWKFENAYNYNDFPVNSSEIIATRNPFYWKIDTDYNQLPYIDRIVFTVVETTEEMVDLVLSGKINMQYRHINTKTNKHVFDNYIGEGNFGYFTTISAHSNTAAIYLNQNNNDTTKRTLFQDKNFRIGLSYAINRSEIISKVYDNSTYPHQVAPVSSSFYYNERLATQYLEYNVSLANEYLDKTGYSETDSEGYRIFNIGNRITLDVYFTDILGSDWPKVITNLVSNWKDVGVELIPYELSRTAFEEVKKHPDHYYDVLLWEGAGGLDLQFVMEQWVPYKPSSMFGPEWGDWYFSNENPEYEEPPEDIQQLHALFENYSNNANQDDQDHYISEILKIAADRFDIIGISTVSDSYGIISNDFKNVPRVIIDSYVYPSPAPTNPCQYFINNTS